MRREYTIVDEAGLHARPASLLVKKANMFPNNILIEYKGRSMTLKSIMVVMSLGIPCGAKFALVVDGDDADQVHHALQKVLVDHRLI